MAYIYAKASYTHRWGFLELLDLVKNLKIIQWLTLPGFWVAEWIYRRSTLGLDDTTVKVCSVFRIKRKGRLIAATPAALCFLPHLPLMFLLHDPPSAMPVCLGTSWLGTGTSTNCQRNKIILPLNLSVQHVVSIKGRQHLWILYIFISIRYYYFSSWLIIWIQNTTQLLISIS